MRNLQIGSILVLLMIGSGCVSVTSERMASLCPPVDDVSRFNGTYDDSAIADRPCSLWHLLQSEMPPEPRPTGHLQTRIEGAGDHSLMAIWLSDGMEIKRKQLEVDHHDGYLFRGARTTLGGIAPVLNTIGVEAIALGLTPTGDLMVARQVGGTLFVTVVPIYGAGMPDAFSFHRQSADVQRKSDVP